MPCKKYGEEVVNAACLHTFGFPMAMVNGPSEAQRLNEWLESPAGQQFYEDNFVPF